MDPSPGIKADFAIGDIISHVEMCLREGASLQRGMNFKLSSGNTVILLSRRPGAPYHDRFEEDGRVLIYEGHDVPRAVGGPDPKSVDQPMKSPGGKFTQNGKFYEAAKRAKGGTTPELVRVYEKIQKGIWTFAGVFELLDAWIEPSGVRKVFKFRLTIAAIQPEGGRPLVSEGSKHQRRIPTEVKLEVWRRDEGKCVQCGSRDHLHYDHVIPFSKGGASVTAENVQLLCARHNLQKRDHIG